MRLVQAIGKLYSKLLQRELNPLSEIIITSGAYEALYSAIMGHVDVGDEVIIIEPFFDCYEPMVKMAGGIAKFIPLKPVSPKSIFKLIYTLRLGQKAGHDTLCLFFKFFFFRPKPKVQFHLLTGNLMRMN